MKPAKFDMNPSTKKSEHVLAIDALTRASHSGASAPNPGRMGSQGEVAGPVS